jgi:membrane complex biogenesis BtpA family protein
VLKYRLEEESPQAVCEGELILPLKEWASRTCPVIGMLHAPPLPGAADYEGSVAAIRDVVLRDAEALVSGGVDGLMLENFGDSPFYPGRVPAITTAMMTSLGCEINSRFQIPLGINVLRNDGCSALAVAVACGASFIRVNVLCSARVADQGILHGIAHDLLRERANLRSNHLQIWADVDVKHSAPLAQRPLVDEVKDLVLRGKADAVIVSGSATGEPIDLATLRTVKDAAPTTPVLIGSGATVETISEIRQIASGIIVGSSLKYEGQAKNPVDPDRVRQFVDQVHRSSQRMHLS